MKRFLPIFLVCFIFVFFAANLSPAFAQLNQGDATPSAGQWISDKDVTFAGKIASRASDILNWVIAHHEWAFIKPGGQNPFDAIWISVRNIVYIFLALAILAASFVLILTRGKSLTVKKFVPRFVLAIVLVTLSFSLIAFIYTVSDVVQGFFLRPNNKIIQSDDLLNVAFDYTDFKGLKKVGEDFQYEESAFMSLLLVKLTAATYYAMFIILIVRKIILWFFIVVSPLFPVLLLFSPLRNSAKIWAGEFFRWLLYGPLFAVFLGGLVSLWKIYIPVDLAGLSCGNPDPTQRYPTSISILLGGPCQDVRISNNLNSPDAYIQYVIALLMLWAVIIVPFLLLKIFLDYFNNFAFGESNIVKFLAQSRLPFSYGGNGGGGPSPGGGPPSKSHPAGMAKSLPSFTHSAMELQRSIAESSNRSAESMSSTMSQTMSQTMNNSTFQVGNIQVPQISAEILNLTNLTIPTMKDVSRYETALMSSNTATSSHSKEEVNKIYEALSRLSGRSPITTPIEHDKYTAIREKIVEQAKKGDAVANSVMSASMPASMASIPERNNVQQVSIEDYEEVKKTWQENYGKIEPPADPSGNPLDRKAWLKQEVAQIPQIIEMLNAQDPAKQRQAKEMVSKVLPFLLLGGFSRQEIIAYLKAKLEAAKSVLADMQKQDVDASTLVETEVKPKEEPKVMHMEAEAPESTSPATPKTLTPPVGKDVK
jgi:hypothetical protein